MKATLAGRLFNVPLLVEASYLETVCRFAQSRITGESVDIDYTGKAPANDLKYFSMVDGNESVASEAVPQKNANIAIVPVMGSLMQRANGIDAMSSSGRGYNTIKNDINSSIRDDDIGGIAMHVATGGGEVAGNFDLSRWIRDIQSQTDKPVWALVDESAYSAGYSIASSADRIHTTRSGGVGSIGVVIAHANYEKMMKKQGVQVTYVHAGKNKVDGNPYQALEGEALSDMRKDIEYHYSHFVELVANNRGISDQAVRDTEAKTFNSDDALQLGLVDAVMSTDESLQEFFEHINTPNRISVSSQGISSPVDNPADGSAVKTTESENMTDVSTITAADVEKAVTDERSRILALLEHDNAGNTSAVVKIANMGLDAEQSIQMMDLVASPEAQVQTTEADASAKDEADVKASALSDIKATLDKIMASGETNGVNTNASKDHDEDVKIKPETVDETYERVMNADRGVLQ